MDRLAPSIKNISNTDKLTPAAKLSLATNADKTDSKNALAAAKRQNKTKWNWSALSEALRDFEYEMGKVKIYPGLIGGINKTFGSNPNAGFQLGLTTEFVINDHISLMGELKYMQRFNGGSIYNNYSENVDNPNNPPIHIVTTDSFTHRFNYSTLSSVELPISVRFRAGRFYVYAGGNLVYNFAINADETSLPAANYVPEVNTYYSTANWRKVTPKMDISDLGSRFGIGYLFGTSYEFTPSIMVDARLTKTFWDNAQTTGGMQISNLLYKAPSIQLSIIYRLNHQRPETVTPKYSF